MACRFLTPKEFMVATNLSRNTVYQGLRDGSIPSVRISKRKILIPEDALERKFGQTLSAHTVS
jgi:excisionase family DNA binding protein